MEVTVKVEIELGPKTIALFLNGGAIAAKSETVNAPKGEVKELAPVKETAPAKEVAPPADKPKATPPAEKPKTEKTKAPAFDELDEDAQLEAIKAEVTKHTKKGKSADIKALLAHFEAARASELNAEQYVNFFDTVVRYGKGESVEDLTGGDLS